MNQVLRTMAIFALLLNLAFAGISVTSYTLSQDTYKPGTSGVMTLTVSNPLSTVGSSYRMTSVSASIYPPAQMTMTSSVDMGDIEAGGTTLLTLPFRVKPDAPSGVYTVDVRLTGFSTASSGQGQDVYSKSVTIPVTVVNPPIFVITSDKGVVGGIETTGLTIANNGGPARNLRMTLSESSAVALYKASDVYIGDLSGMRTVEVTLDTRSASDGPVDIPVIFTYEDELGILHSDTVTIRLTAKNEVLDLGFRQLQPLVTRQDGTLSLEVVNNGQAISDVRLSFVNTTLQLTGRTEVKLGDIAAGETKTISADVHNELEPGLSPVRAKVEWVERDIRKEQYIDIPLTITSDADVGVYLEAKPLPLALGGQHTISVQVSNVGTYPIENVDVSLSSPALRTLDISDRLYIGGLQTDDFSSVQFLVQVNATAEGTYPVYVDVRYRDSSGEWKGKTVTQQVTLHASPQAAESPLPLLALLGAAAVAVWYFKFRKVSR